MEGALLLPGDRAIRRVGRNLETEEYPPDRLTIEETERAIVSESVEWLYVYALDGRQLARFRGTRSTVSISDDLAARAGSHGLYGVAVLRDCTIVHNHPPESDVESFPLSPSDLMFAVTHDLSRFIVVAGQHRYELQRPGLFWPVDESELHRLVQAHNVGLDRVEGAPADTAAAYARRNERNVELLHQEGIVDYERSEIANDD
jgi:hypothetical protein